MSEIAYAENVLPTGSHNVTLTITLTGSQGQIGERTFSYPGGKEPMRVVNEMSQFIRSGTNGEYTASVRFGHIADLAEYKVEVGRFGGHHVFRDGERIKKPELRDELRSAASLCRRNFRDEDLLPAEPAEKERPVQANTKPQPSFREQMAAAAKKAEEANQSRQKMPGKEHESMVM